MSDLSDLFNPRDIAEAKKLGLEDWLTQLASWDAQLAASYDDSYLTDIRHLSNLTDPFRWTSRENPDDRVVDFCADVVDAFVEDRVGEWWE